MKKAIFLALVVALVLGAYLSRPENPRKDLAEFLVKKQGRNRVFAEMTATSTKIENRYLWLDVQQDGQTIYTSVFHQWIDRDPVYNAARSIAWENAGRIAGEVGHGAVADIVRESARKIASEIDKQHDAEVARASQQGAPSTQPGSK